MPPLARALNHANDHGREREREQRTRDAYDLSERLVQPATEAHVAAILRIEQHGLPSVELLETTAIVIQLVDGEIARVAHVGQRTRRSRWHFTRQHRFELAAIDASAVLARPMGPRARHVRETRRAPNQQAEIPIGASKFVADQAECEEHETSAENEVSKFFPTRWLRLLFSH